MSGLFSNYVAMAEHAMEKGEVGLGAYRGAAGVLFLQAEKVAFAISGDVGGGLLFKKNDDGKWTQPAAMTLFKMGIGASFGAANRDTIIILNRFAMKRFVEGKVKLDIQADLGGAVGPRGASAAAGIGVSEKGGAATAFAYTKQEGVILELEAGMGGLYATNRANMEFYGTQELTEIFEGKAPTREEDKAKLAELMEKVEQLTTKNIEEAPEVPPEEEAAADAASGEEKADESAAGAAEKSEEAAKE